MPWDGITMYDLEEIKKLAAKGKNPGDFDVDESVLFHTFRYCYRAYKKDPTEKTKERLKNFLEPVIKTYYRKEGGESQ